MNEVDASNKVSGHNAIKLKRERKDAQTNQCVK